MSGRFDLHRGDLLRCIHRYADRAALYVVDHIDDDGHGTVVLRRFLKNPLWRDGADRDSFVFPVSFAQADAWFVGARA